MRKLIESIDECMATEGPMGMPMSAPPMAAPEDKGNPVTVSVSMNASGKEHVADLLDMMKNAGVGGAEEVSSATLGPRLDMEKFMGAVGGPPDGGGGDEGIENEGAMSDIHQDAQEMGKEEFVRTHPEMADMWDEVHNDPENQEAIETMGGKYSIKGKNEVANAELARAAGQAKVEDGEDDDDEDDDEFKDDEFTAMDQEDDDEVNKHFEDEVAEWANSAPGEEASDRGDIGDYEDNIRDGNDLNRKKKSYPATQGGDNPMAVENIKAKLMKALTEKKAKPDFLDVDKDGDKKEPMKKALKDKGGNKPKKGVKPSFKKGVNPFESVKEGSFKKADAKGDGSAKFDEMGCKKEMKRLDASGCSKTEMAKKVSTKYGCDKGTFEKLYASSCGNH